MIPMTFTKERNAFEYALLSVVLGLTGLNLFLCTLERIKSLPGAVLIIHLGAIATLIGSVVSSFGFVSTVNVYEGSSVDEAYRWDIQKDVDLGLELTVNKIHREFYPIPLKVGVLRGQEKIGLFFPETGESFRLGDYTVRADALELGSRNLKLSVFNREGMIGTAETRGARNLPSNFPYNFVLVAFKTPSLKRTWLDLTLRRGAETLAAGTTEVNSPFSWEGLSFYHTSVDVDEYGIPYAGLQITKDPGRPFVYVGFIIIGIGSLLFLFDLVRRSHG